MQALAADHVGKPEKRDLSIGFIPITCATPIIMAEPMGFYSKRGLNAKVKRPAGWAMVRDWAINKDVDAAHYASNPANQKQIVKAIAPANYSLKPDAYVKRCLIHSMV